MSDEDPPAAPEAGPLSTTATKLRELVRSIITEEMKNLAPLPTPSVSG